MHDKDKILNLLDQIIERVEQEDSAHKNKMLSINKASQAIGESWMLFHLKALKELVKSVK